MNSPSFIHLQLVSVIASMLLPALSHADTLTLKEGDILTGKLLSVTDESISLQSPVTSAAIQIKPEELKKIIFSDTEAAPVSHSELITLKNGDLLPCSIRSLDEKSLLIDTWFAGELRLPRTSLSTVQFGVSQPTVVFNDDPNLSDWDIDRGQWSVVSKKNNGITTKYYECLNRGSIAKKIVTPNSINISYDLEWSSSINFTFKFCAHGKGTLAKQSSYQLFITYDGVEVKRLHDDSTKRLLKKQIKVNDLQSKKIRVSIHLNKKSGELNTLINGKLIETTSYDSLPPVDGHYMSFNFASGDSSRISNFKITTSSLTKNKILLVNALSGSSDLLIDNESNQLEGDIEIIKNNPSHGKNTISFLPKNAPDKALEIPESRINTLYFGRIDEEEIKPNSNSVVTIMGNGTIQLSNLQITDQKITGNHPDIGACEIKLKAASTIIKQTAPRE